MKLSSSEIDQALKKIREEYDHLMVHYEKNQKDKQRFEERFEDTLRNRKDMMLFLGVEIQVVKELLLRAEREKQAGPALPPKEKKSYADRVLEKLRERIKDYPALGLPASSQLSIDVDKLYGTLDWFKRQVWPSLYQVLKKKDPDANLNLLDEHLAQLTPWQDKYPKELELYVQLYLSDTSLNQISRSQNQCLILGAQYFHGLLVRLQSCESRWSEKKWELEKPSPGEIALVTKTKNLVERILDDFRLKDIGKPKD